MSLLQFQEGRCNWYLHRGSIVKASGSFCSSAVFPSPDEHPLDAWFYFLHFLYSPVHKKILISGPELAGIYFWWRHSYHPGFLVFFSCQLEWLILFWMLSLFLLPVERPLMLNNHWHFLVVFCEMTPNLQWSSLNFCQNYNQFTHSSRSTFHQQSSTTLLLAPLMA